jgi:hypothetical protein
MHETNIPLSNAEGRIGQKLWHQDETNTITTKELRLAVGRRAEVIIPISVSNSVWNNEI